MKKDRLQRKPAKTRRKPGRIRLKVIGTGWKPTGIQRKPAGTGRKPIGIRWKPIGIQRKLTGTGRKPTGFYPIPAGTGQEPGRIGLKPIGIGQEPGEIQRKPIGEPMFLNSIFTPFADAPKEAVRTWGKRLTTECILFRPGNGKGIKREFVEREYKQYSAKFKVNTLWSKTRAGLFGDKNRSTGDRIAPSDESIFNLNPPHLHLPSYS